MKKYFMLLAAAATVLAVSCNKEKNQPTVDPTPEIEDNTPQPIRFGTNIAEVKAPITKAAIENDGWNGEQLYIYAFGTANGGTVDLSNLLIGSATAGAGATAPTVSPTGSRDAINLYDKVTYPNENIPYYYKVGDVYNFFGYYYGDATAGTMTANYELPLTIDGDDDIMVATTDKIVDYMAANATISLDKVYSDVSARASVVPDLMFKHQLSRFKFRVKYAGTGDAAAVSIKSLTLKSYNTGNLVVAAADPANVKFNATTTGDRADLALKGYTPYTGTADFAAAFHPTAAFTALGESILAVPEGDANTHAKYNGTITVGQANAAVNPTAIQEQPINFEIDFEKVLDPTTHNPIEHPYAEPGKQYTVDILVYGFEEIEITVSLEDWGEGGSTEIDSDADTRAAVAIVAALAENSIAVNGTTTVTVTSAIAATTPDETNVVGSIQVSSSNTRVATVVKDGNTITVTGVNPGTCNIYLVVPGTTTYQSGFVALPLTVTAVDNRTVTTLYGVPDNQTITTSGGTYQIPAVSVQVGGVDLDPQPVITYESSDNSIATVGNTGLVTAVANGAAIITIKYAGDATYKPIQGTFNVTCSNQATP